MKPRILIIRGGAIGDFILTLPALGLVREAFPAAHIEIIGYRHIVALAEGRFYADASRSIEYGPLAGFFARNGTLDEELRDYFGGFQQVISYLFDPDRIFETNLARCGVKHYLNAHVRIDDTAHASQQLARPLQQMALYLEAAAAVLHPTEDDRQAAELIRPKGDGDFITIHPGSGSPRKNWPAERWRQLIEHLLAQGRRLVMVGGEADGKPLSELESAFAGTVQIVRDLPLPQLGALLARSSSFIGHDSGISHLAAAAGARCVLLFGPTDPAIWAPVNKAVSVMEAPDGDLQNLTIERVIETIELKP
ncbi:MAG TPA: glycosyltransferase family 9 protein [Chthoniobacteraceae bacterium]|nr:glycosyltransferase family 9 protein [Chthoniobacteraceae bacterium]